MLYYILFYYVILYYTILYTILYILCRWAVLRDASHCFVVFRGSETVLDWTENGYLSLRRVAVPEWHGRP